MKTRNAPLLGLAVGLALAGQAAAQVQDAPPRTMEEQKTMPPQDPAWSRLDADGFVTDTEYRAHAKASEKPENGARPTP